jgi:hypothetical protein
MFEVIVMVCLAATGEDCREYKLTGKDYSDAISCIRESHGDAAAWQDKNTGYTIIGTRCAEGAKVPVAPNS